MSALSPSSLPEAIECHRRGDLQSAERIYRAVLQQQPDNPQALHLLGVLALQCGKPAYAVPLIERAIAVQPSEAAFHGNLGEAYRGVGQPQRAEACFQMALRLQPNNADAAYNYGLLCMQLGQAEEAARLFRQAIQQRPNFAVAYNNLGNACRTLGDIEQAEANFRRAVELQPQLGFAHGNLGQLLLDRGQLEEARQHCGEAVRLQPQSAPARNNLGNVFRRLQQTTNAKACYLEALRLQPNLAMAHSNVGEILRDEGKLDEAQRWISEAARLEPNNARFHASLAALAYDRHDPMTEEVHLRDALRLDPRNEEARLLSAQLCFVRGQLDQAQKEYRLLLQDRPDNPMLNCRLADVLLELNQGDEAMICLRNALRVKPDCITALALLAAHLRDKMPDEEYQVLLRLQAEPNVPDVDRAALHFSLAQVRDARGEYDEAAHNATQANRLQEGLRRQGAKVRYNSSAHVSFVDRLLTVFTPEFFERVRDFGSDSERPVFVVGLPRSGTTLLEQVLSSHSRVHGAGELRFIREDFEALGGNGGNNSVGEARSFDALEKIDADAVRRVAQNHLDRLHALDGTAERVIDKMPDNYLYLGLMALLYPRARILHCCRDQRDVAVSCWITHFRDIPWASDMDLIAARFAQYRRVIEHWREVLPVPVLDVHYEDMVADLEGTARHAVDFLGLEWEENCLQFHDNKRPVRTASLSQVRQPIYRRSVARWRNYEHSLRPLFARLGYADESTTSDQPDETPVEVGAV